MNNFGLFQNNSSTGSMIGGIAGLLASPFLGPASIGVGSSIGKAIGGGIDQKNMAKQLDQTYRKNTATVNMYQDIARQREIDDYRMGF